MNSTLKGNGISLDEQVQSILDSLIIDRIIPDYTFEGLIEADEGKLPSYYFVNKKAYLALPEKTREAVYLLFRGASRFAHLHKGTGFSIGDVSSERSLYENIEEEEQLKKPLALTIENIEHILKRTTTLMEGRNDNIDGVTKIAPDKDGNYFIEGIGYFFGVVSIEEAYDKGIPNSRIIGKRFPYSDQIGSRNLSAFAMASKEGRIARKEGREADYLTITLSSTGMIRVYSDKGIIISALPSEVVKSELYSQGVFAYNMNDKLLKKTYGEEADILIEEFPVLDNSYSISSKEKPDFKIVELFEQGRSKEIRRKEKEVLISIA